MDQADLKSEMLVVFTFVRKELDDLCDGLTPQEKTLRGSLQCWSVKDMLAHLAFWESHFNRQLEKGLAGQPVPVSGNYLNQVNDGVLLEHLDQPFEEARADEEGAYQYFLNLIEGISAEDLADVKKYPYLEGRSLLDRALGSYGYHPAAHISDHYLQAGQVEKARSLQETLTERLCQFPSWKTNSIYNLACFYSLNGWKDKAIEKLTIAFAEKPDLVDWAEQDSDMDPLRELAAYQALTKK
jgi:hypothetical protein